MELNEKITAIIDKTGVSTAEAEAALGKNGGDVLDAVLALERAGLTKTINKADHIEADNNENIEKLEGDVVNKDGTRAGTTAEKAARFGDSVVRLVKALLKQMFVVERKGEELLSVPVFILVLLLIFGFTVIIPLAIVGLFLGCHYRVEGAKKFTVDINDLSERASRYAEDLKAEYIKRA